MFEPLQKYGRDKYDKRIAVYIIIYIPIHTYILRAYYYITAKFPHADMARANAEHRIINYIYYIINFLSRKYF